VRWITISTLSLLAVVLLGLVYLHERGLRGSPECGGGFACPSLRALDAAASDDCREFGALARKDGTDFDPYGVARAYAWRRRSGDLAAYWGCLDGLGISWKPGIDWKPRNWTPPPQ
jgi:hypothetical protein